MALVDQRQYLSILMTFKHKQICIPHTGAFERPFWKPPLVLCKYILNKRSIMARGHELRHVQLGIHKKMRYASFRACQCVSFFSTPYQMCRWTGVHYRHPFWCVVFTPSLDSSPLGLMVIESWLTHVFFACIACMSNGWFIVTPFYRVLYCTSEGAAINRSINLCCYLLIYASIYVAIYVAIYLSIYLSIHPSIHLSIYLSLSCGGMTVIHITHIHRPVSGLVDLALNQSRQTLESPIFRSLGTSCGGLFPKPVWGTKSATLSLWNPGSNWPWLMQNVNDNDDRYGSSKQDFLITSYNPSCHRPRHSSAYFVLLGKGWGSTGVPELRILQISRTFSPSKRQKWVTV